MISDDIRRHERKCINDETQGYVIIYVLVVQALLIIPCGSDFVWTFSA